MRFLALSCAALAGFAVQPALAQTYPAPTQLPPPAAYGPPPGSYAAPPANTMMSRLRSVIRR